MARLIFPLLLGSALAMCVGAPMASAKVVKKTAEGFESGLWRASATSSATGNASVANTPAPAEKSEKSLLVEPNFTGTFGAFGAAPPTPLVIPGDAKSVSLWVNLSDARYGVKVSFRDGYGRARVDGKYLIWTVPTKGAIGAWKQATFAIPADWVRPIEIASIEVDNWEAKLDKRQVQLLVDQIEIETDVTNVDPAGVLTTWKPDPAPTGPHPARKVPLATPLADIGLSTPIEGNVFAGRDAAATIALRNWRTEALAGKLSYRVVDQAGAVVLSESRDVNVESQSGIDLSIKTERHGLYAVEAELASADGQKLNRRLTYASIPKPRELTEAEKMISPYGLNYGSADRSLVKPFRDAGIVWFREYAFSYPWMLQSKGDGTYAGWPYPKRIAQGYKDIDAKFIAVLQLAIKRPTIEDGKPVGPLGPNLEWVRNISHILLSFPEIQYWETANEYDNPPENRIAEEAVGWKNYQLYHAKLADLVELFSDGKGVTIENGHPGIFPDREEINVKSGLFDKIKVINSHHYTGTEPPETNWYNYNTFSNELVYREPGLLFDQLRASTRMADIDGKDREHWFTEFGWDTLVGPVVSQYEQAVYLQRGWMLSMAAGCEKAFWFYHFDAATPVEFFDGCGLFSNDAQPKLAVASLAGITSIMPTPKYVGTIDAGPNTAGYIFEQDGKLVASLFTIAGEGDTATFEAEKLFDYLGNPLPGKSAKLTMSPVYAVGLNRESSFYHQTAYSLDTPYLIAGTSGDEVTSVVMINNNRSSPIDATITPALPEGWGVDQKQVKVTVAPGEQKRVAFKIRVGEGIAHKVEVVGFDVHEKQAIRRIPLRVNRQPAVVMRVPSLEGKPGEANLSVRVGNNAVTPREGKLQLKLPKSWQAKEATIPVAAIQPGEAREIPISINWDTSIADGETAYAEFDTGVGPPVRQPIIPNQYKLHRASSIKVDGDLTDWPASARIPAWMLGSTLGEADADIRVAWTPEGLYGAAEVVDSKIVNRDPTRFWTGDTLEMFVRTGDDPKSLHQFWIIPMPAQSRAYVGRWKMGAEIEASQFDLKDVQTYSRKTERGYVMEFFLPASIMNGYAPKAGGELGLNLNLSARGERFNREVYWPRAKRDGVQSRTDNWGTVKLLD